MVSSIPSLYAHGHPYNHEGCPDPKVFDIVDPAVAASIFSLSSTTGSTFQGPTCAGVTKTPLGSG